MSDTEFPSGPWTGFYNYGANSSKHRMDLSLTFANGNLTGGGNDDLGPFVIQGSYDPKSKECHWTKTYVGAHDVFYRGFREGKGIWGTWEIEMDSTGGFHIWPLGSGADETESESEEKEEPVQMVGVKPIGTGALRVVS